MYIVAKTTEKGTTSYGYDTLDHLTSAAYSGTGQINETYTYDGIANRITDTKTAAATWVYDANNQLKTAGTLSYTYDDNDNTTNQTDTANAANTRNYVYDNSNRPHSKGSQHTARGHTQQVHTARGHTHSKHSKQAQQGVTSTARGQHSKGSYTASTARGQKHSKGSKAQQGVRPYI